MPANPAPKCCHCSEETVRESGLLSAQRMAEVTAEIDRRIEPCFDRHGRELQGANIAECADGRMLFPRTHSEHEREYLRRTVMAGVLTEAELERVNKLAQAILSARIAAKRFSDARRLESWDGGVFWGDDFFDSIDALRDHLEAHGDEWPAFVWAARPYPVITRRTVVDVFGDQMADRGGDDMGLDALRGVDELQAALDRFVEANADVKCFVPDYTAAILLAQVAQKT